jgi:hypothetical protein
MQLFDMIRLLLVGFLDPAHSIRFRVSLALQARECLSILCNLGEEQTRALAKCGPYQLLPPQQEHLLRPAILQLYRCEQ